LESLAKTKKLEALDATNLLAEVNHDYLRTMNKIIFDKYLDEDSEVTLQLEPEEEYETKYYGMMEVSKEK
jgi:dynein heavy chain, axonemal